MCIKNKLIFLSVILFTFFPHAYAAQTAHRVSDTTIQNQVLFYINQYRKQHGLSKLKMDTHMVIQAKRHSQDMANHRMPFGHKDFQKRIATLRSQIKNTGGGAENVAYNYKDAQEVVRQWVQSPGHKRNIVGHYNLTGIGVARDKQGKLYYTQIFLQTGTNSSYGAKHPFVRFNPFFSIQRNG